MYNTLSNPIKKPTLTFINNISPSYKLFFRNISTIPLDSTRVMKNAHRIYRSVGFREIKPYSESEIPEEIRHNWIFMELVLNDDLKVENQS